MRAPARWHKEIRGAHLPRVHDGVTALPGAFAFGGGEARDVRGFITFRTVEEDGTPMTFSVRMTEPEARELAAKLLRELDGVRGARS